MLNFKTPPKVKPVPGFDLFYRKPTLRAYSDPLMKAEFSVWFLRWTICDSQGELVFNGEKESLDIIRDAALSGDIFRAINEDSEKENPASETEEQKKTSQTPAT